MGKKSVVTFEGIYSQILECGEGLSYIIYFPNYVLMSFSCTSICKLVQFQKLLLGNCLEMLVYFDAM